jgi:rhodanese-related sulfurtransferase
MAMSFMQIAEEAMAQVEGISAAEVQKRMKQDSNALLVDVRDAADIPSTGLATGGLNISLGMLPVRADLELPEDWREPRLQDRSLPVITACQLGPNGAIGAKILKDMGFTNVSYLDGGMEAWKAAGLPTD